MLCLIAEIAMLVYGLIGLIGGQLKLSAKSYVTGTPARIAGLFLLLPLPLGFGAVFLLGVWMVAKGEFHNEQQLRETLQTPAMFIEAGVVVVCLVIALCIANAYAHPPDRHRDLDEEFFYDKEQREPPRAEEGRLDTPAPPPQEPDDRFRRDDRFRP